MSNIVKIIGQRFRNYRTEKNLSQEKVAELSGLHPTYIGQVERGEKNCTLESLCSIAKALEIPLSQIFEKIEDTDATDSIPLKCYEFVASKTKSEQEQIYRVLLEMDKYKNK